MSRPILLAMTAGSSGWQLLRSLLRQNYLDAFDRRNLVSGPRWSRQEARIAVRLLWPDLVDRTVVVLGSEPRDAIGLRPELIHPVQVGQTVFRQLPHPSGRSLWYNDPTNRLLAGMLLEELYDSHSG